MPCDTSRSHFFQVRGDGIILEALPVSLRYQEAPHNKSIETTGEKRHQRVTRRFHDGLSLEIKARVQRYGNSRQLVILPQIFVKEFIVRAPYRLYSTCSIMMNHCRNFLSSERGCGKRYGHVRIIGRSEKIEPFS